MSEFIKVNTSPDFLKDFMIEDPSSTIDTKQDKVEDTKNKLNTIETADSIEALEKTLAEEAKEDTVEDTTDKKDKSTKDTKEVPDKKVEDTKENKKEDTPEESDDQYSFKPFIDTMIEHGILDELDGVELGDSAEDLVEAFESTVNNRIVNGIEEYKESIPELGKRFLDYIERGGDPQRFLEAQTAPIDFSNLDMSDENNQKSVLKEYLRIQGYTPEEIKDTIQDYEESIILEKQAKIAGTKLQKYHEKQTELLIQEQEAELKQREKELNDYVTSVQKIIKDSKTLAGLEVSDKDRKDFEAYIFKKGKDGLTQYQRELGENPVQTQAELAFLKYKKYDFNKATKKAESEAARKIRQSIISKNETTLKGGASNNQVSNQSFSAFEKMVQNMRKQ